MNINSRLLANKLAAGAQRRIPFNSPAIVGREINYVQDAVERGHISRNGFYGALCQQFLEETFQAKKVLLTSSGTSALEIAALLVDLNAGDEVILPSFTHVSTANAFFLRGATLRFVDIRPDTLNLDENLIDDAITDRCKVIVPVHYAGVSCNLDSIKQRAKSLKLFVVEDAAQGVNARYHGAYLGTIGDLAGFSFHETKNINCGEGGALLINNSAFIERAEVLREMGTNRNQFARGEVDKYTWVDVGSSYGLSDLAAAYLYGQLEYLSLITKRRHELYCLYLQLLAPLSEHGLIQLPTIPDGCESNHHIFYIMVADPQARNALIQHLKIADITAVFHYTPLHTSPMGLRLGYHPGMLPVTEYVSDRILRLPLYHELGQSDVERVVQEIFNFFGIKTLSA